MGFFAAIGFITFFYYVINIIFWIVLDCDIELWYKQRWGKRVGEKNYISTVYTVHQLRSCAKNIVLRNFGSFVNSIAERESCLDNWRIKRHW